MTLCQGEMLEEEEEEEVGSRLKTQSNWHQTMASCGRGQSDCRSVTDCTKYVVQVCAPSVLR